MSETATKAEAIPADIDQIATDIVRADYSNQSMVEPDWLLYEAIARAILAERKAERSRCNEILRDAWGKQLSLDAIDDVFLARLVENAFSWALEQTNYLDPKHALRLVDATRNGMKAEEASVWRSDTPEIEARKARLAAEEMKASERASDNYRIRP